jgi:DNA-directed RNA polymerase specialized sigma24 family protein
VLDALFELLKARREVFDLSDFFNYSVKEIPEKTGIPVNTVTSRKQYTVQTLRKGFRALYTDIMRRE